MTTPKDTPGAATCRADHCPSTATHGLHGVPSLCWAHAGELPEVEAKPKETPDTAELRRLLAEATPAAVDDWLARWHASQAFRAASVGLWKAAPALLDAVESLQRERDQARAEVEALQRQAGALRAALQGFMVEPAAWEAGGTVSCAECGVEPPSHRESCPYIAARAALASTAGAGWTSPEEHARVQAELTEANHLHAVLLDEYNDLKAELDKARDIAAFHDRSAKGAIENAGRFKAETDDLRARLATAEHDRNTWKDRAHVLSLGGTATAQALAAERDEARARADAAAGVLNSVHEAFVRGSNTVRVFSGPEGAALDAVTAFLRSTETKEPHEQFYRRNLIEVTRALGAAERQVRDLTARIADRSQLVERHVYDLAAEERDEARRLLAEESRQLAQTCGQVRDLTAERDREREARQVAEQHHAQLDALSTVADNRIDELAAERDELKQRVAALGRGERAQSVASLREWAALQRDHAAEKQEDAPMSAQAHEMEADALPGDPRISGANACTCEGSLIDMQRRLERLEQLTGFAFGPKAPPSCSCFHAPEQHDNDGCGAENWASVRCPCKWSGTATESDRG